MFLYYNKINNKNKNINVKFILTLIYILNV